MKRIEVFISEGDADRRLGMLEYLLRFVRLQGAELPRATRSGRAALVAAESGRARYP